MDEQTRQKARDEMVSYDEWVVHVVPILRKALLDSSVKGHKKGIQRDRTDLMMTFTTWMMTKAQEGDQYDDWAYDRVLGRLCAALYRLGEIEQDMIDGNRRMR